MKKTEAYITIHFIAVCTTYTHYTIYRDQNNIYEYIVKCAVMFWAFIKIGFKCIFTVTARLYSFMCVPCVTR